METGWREQSSGAHSLETSSGSWLVKGFQVIEIWENKLKLPGGTKARTQESDLSGGSGSEAKGSEGNG